MAAFKRWRKDVWYLSEVWLATQWLSGRSGRPVLKNGKKTGKVWHVYLITTLRSQRQGVLSVWGQLGLQRVSEQLGLHKETCLKNKITTKEGRKEKGRKENKNLKHHESTLRNHEPWSLFGGGAALLGIVLSLGWFLCPLTPPLEKNSSFLSLQESPENSFWN